MSADFTAPHYGARSLAGLLPAVAEALGVSLGEQWASGGIELPPGERYVVFLIDGLGWELLGAHPHAAPFLSSLAEGREPITVGAPSTTVTSLTSLGTALAPGAHGIVGYTSRIPGTTELLNALQWSKEVDPVRWQPNATVYDRLEKAGVRTTVVNKSEFENSGLTVASSRGAKFIGASRWGERLAAVLESVRGAPSLTYMYDGDLDWTGHRYGVASTQWEQQLSMIDAEAEHVRDVLPDDVGLVVVADHGMVDIPEDARVDVDAVPALRDGVVLLGGEARFRHVYCRAGAVEDVAATWRETLGDRAEVVLRDELGALGWFGDITPEVRPRIGDVVVASRGDTAIVSSVDFEHEAKLVGMHGSLTSAEMLVPLLVC